MKNNQDIKKASFFQGNEFSNISLLIPKLKSSFKLQKELIKEIEQHLQTLIYNEVQNNMNSSSNNFIDTIPYIIKELGISFAHIFLHNANIYYNLIGLYFDKKEKNDINQIKKIVLIFQTCLDIFKLIASNEELNNIKEHLYEMQIIEKQNEIYNNEAKDEEKIYENYYAILNGLKTLIQIGKDTDKLDELSVKYINLKKDIRILGIKYENYNKALFEFFNELLVEIDECFKKINLMKPMEIISENKKLEEIKNIPLDKRTFFYLNEKIKERKNELIEFRNYSLPLTNKEEGEEIKRQICGFLNSRGGRLYIGINNQNIVKGIILNSKARDTSRNNLVNLTYDFYPNCRIDKILIYFIPIKNPKTNEFIPKRYIVKIRVYPGDPDVLYSMSSTGYHSIIRRNDISYELNSAEICQEIIARDEIKKIKDKDNNYIKELNIRDPEPEININEDNDEENDDLPLFGVDNNKNLSDSIKKIIKEKGKRPIRKKNKNNMVREGTITVKVTNIDEKVPINDVNRFFNGCKCASQKMLNGYGYLNFSSLNDANNCIARYNGCKLGNKFIKLSITNN